MARRHVAQLSIAISLSVLLAGCQGTLTPLSPATSNPDSQIRPTQVPVPAPTSREDALAHASAAVNAAETVLVEILRGEVAADSLSGYEADSYLATTNEFIDGLAESSTFVGILGEASRWHPDAALSSTATVVADGVDYPFGEVTALGCFESLWEVNDPGQEQTGETSIGQFLPARMVVRYEPSLSVWLVTEGKSMVGEAGAPECPAAG